MPTVREEATVQAEQRFTHRPFTVAVCTACDGETFLMARLREMVRSCPHGMLVATRCLLGEFTCATRGSRGAMLLLQPCTTDRVPTAAIHWLGPIRTESDAAEACAWISDGVWARDTLPLTLRADLNLTRSARQN
jgi:hypothetical protein